jgi:hypothetical protein
LIIRNAQMQVFEEARLPEFEDYMVEHLKDFSPLHSESLGDARMRSLVKIGMERAKKYGFTHRGPVRFYIETIILLGIDFDSDPQFPWAAKFLSDPTNLNQTERADAIYDELMDYLDKVGGPDREYSKRALRKVGELPFEPISIDDPVFTESVMRRMQDVYPEKADFMETESLQELIRQAVKEAKKMDVLTDAGVYLFVGLMFMIGHGFIRDPMYPWIANTLGKPAVDNPDRRIERLHAKAMIYVEHVLLHINGK